MNLSKILTVGKIIYPLKAKSRNSLFSELIQPIFVDNMFSDAPIFVKEIRKREDEFTTQIENGVAVPHAVTGTVSRLQMCVGVYDNDGISISKRKNVVSRLFFMLAVPASAPTAHLPILRHIVKFSQSEARVKRVFVADTCEDILRVILAYRG